MGTILNCYTQNIGIINDPIYSCIQNYYCKIKASTENNVKICLSRNEELNNFKYIIINTSYVNFFYNCTFC